MAFRDFRETGPWSLKRLFRPEICEIFLLLLFSYCRRFRVLEIAVTGGDVSMILLIDNTHANARSFTVESTAKMFQVNTVVIKTISVDG